jgi:carbamoyl-phosphate synthase large subunit
MLGERLSQEPPEQKCYAVKSIVFPFLKLLGTDIKLGPEMRSTGETMGIGRSFEMAYYKALLAAGIRITGERPAAFLSFRDEDKRLVPELTALLKKLGFTVYGTIGTVGSVEGAITVPKIGRGHPDVLDLIESGTVNLVVNTPTKGGLAHTDGFRMREASIQRGIPCITSINTAFELLKAIDKLRKGELEIGPLGSWK